MKVTFRLPSKKVGYGYAEVEFESDIPDDDPGLLGAAYARYVLDFQVGEIDAVERYQAEMAAAEALLKQELGAVKVSEEVHEQPKQEDPDGPPWQAPAPAVAPKPWETAPKVSLF